MRLSPSVASMVRTMALRRPAIYDRAPARADAAAHAAARVMNRPAPG